MPAARPGPRPALALPCLRPPRRSAQLVVAVGAVSAGVCRDCGSDVVWARTEKGHRIPLDPARLSRDDDTANQAVYRDHLGSLRTRVPTAENPIANHEWRAMPHFATCRARTVARDAQAGRIPNVIPLKRHPR